MAKDKVMKAGNDGVEEIVGSVVSKKKSKDFHIDSDPKDVVDFLLDGGETIFDKNDLPLLEQEHLNELPYRVVQEYLVAKAARDKPVEGLEIVGMLGNSAGKRLALPERRGYYRTWKRPDQLDDALEAGYKQVRREEKGDKPGEGTGEVLKVGPRESPELLAVEIPIHRKIAHNMAVSQKSKQAYKANKDGFRTAVEQVNRTVPDKNDRVVIVDDER